VQILCRSEVFPVREKKADWTISPSRIHLLADSIVWVYKVLPEEEKEKDKLATMREECGLIMKNVS
jgi:hypothetical protein